MKQLLIAFNFRRNRLADNAAFVRMLNDTAEGHYCAAQGALKEFIFTIKTGNVTITDGMNNRDIKEYDGVNFRLWKKEAEAATAAALYLQHYRVPFWDTEVVYGRRNNKLTELVQLAQAGFSVPHSIYMNQRRLKEAVSDNTMGFDYPFVLKDIYGARGTLNFLVETPEQLADILAANPTVRFVAQQFIRNECDYRFLVFGEQVRLVIRRTRQEHGTHLNNVSQGAKAELVPVESFKDDIQRMAVEAARLTDREIAGVDILMTSDTQKPMLLEVNSEPELMKVYGHEKISSLSEFFKQVL